MYAASTIDLSILFSGDIPLFHAETYLELFFMSRKDAKAQSFVLCFLGGLRANFGMAPPFALHKCSALKQKSLPTKILDRIKYQLAVISDQLAFHA